MIAFYERPTFISTVPKYEKWRKWCKDNTNKREKLVSRLHIAIANCNKTLERDVKNQIKKINDLRFK